VPPPICFIISSKKGEKRKIAKKAWNLYIFTMNIEYSTPGGKTDKLEEPVNRELNIAGS